MFFEDRSLIGAHQRFNVHKLLFQNNKPMYVIIVMQVITKCVDYQLAVVRIHLISCLFEEKVKGLLNPLQPHVFLDHRNELR